MKNIWNQITFLMSCTQRSPQPRESVLKISTWQYCRLVKHWFWQRSPAGQTCGWHSYSSMRLMHSESIPQGVSSDALQLQRGISERSAEMISTLPIGLFTYWIDQDKDRYHHNIKLAISLIACLVWSCTLICLYGGGFLSFRRSSWSCRSSFSACSSLNLSAASSKAKPHWTFWFQKFLFNHWFQLHQEPCNTTRFLHE